MNVLSRALIPAAIFATVASSSGAQDGPAMDAHDPLNERRYGLVEETYCAPEGKGMKMILSFGGVAELRSAQRFMPQIRAALRADAQRQYEVGDAFNEGIFKTHPTLLRHNITDWNFFAEARPVSSCTPTPNIPRRG